MDRENIEMEVLKADKKTKNDRIYPSKVVGQISVQQIFDLEKVIRQELLDGGSLPYK